MVESRTGWTNASVVNFAAGADPIAKMEQEARQAVLCAVDEGWQGPPFDPIELARIMGISVRPNAALADARVFWAGDGFQIEYNPHRPRGRVNFSIAHEIAHTFFPDCAEEVRNRSREKWERRNWQLEVLCNVGAAELTMPVGSFPSDDDAVVTIEELMRLRKDFQVSAEAVLLRLVKLASSSVACFSATRVPKPDNTAEYRMEYRIASSHWPERTTRRGQRRFRSRVLDECVAIGTTSKGTETWEPNAPAVHVEAVALPPLPGIGHLRIAGFVRPAAEAPDVRRIEYRQGNAAVFAADADAAIVHIVNDKAQRWGPHGFARAVRRGYPSAYDDYAAWKTKNPQTTALGAIHVAGVEGHNRYVVSLVAQRGYGGSVASRIQYGALDVALRNARDRLREAGVRLVQMPKIGTGQAGGNWRIIEGLIRERLVSAGFEVRVIDLPPR
ncbi:MAG: ImmA/IrrE family metallo-endopeptidase [Gammaproteobacteria bacterium]|nr:ImmA/IrrE family metallo-endopeptidase [Gammaproteobacteria bacterium]